MLIEERNFPFVPDTPTLSSGRAHSSTHPSSKAGYNHSTVAARGRRRGEPIRASVALAKRMLEAANRLVAERYAWRGYIDPAPERADDGRVITLIAENAALAVVGTVTV